VVGAAVLALLLVSPAGFAQQKGNFVCEPPNILTTRIRRGHSPARLEPELDRVRGEVRFIFGQALAEMRALPPLTRRAILRPFTAGICSGPDLGKLMNFDENMSPFRNEACASCHMPYAAYTARSRP